MDFLIDYTPFPLSAICLAIEIALGRIHNCDDGVVEFALLYRRFTFRRINSPAEYLP